MERQDAVAGFCPDLVGVDVDRQCQGAVETPGRPFTAVHCRLVVVLDALPSGDTKGIALDPDVEVRLAHARHLDDRDNVVALAEDVDRRIGTAGAQPRPEPAAPPERVDRTLELAQLFEGVKQHRHDLILLSEASRPRPGTGPRTTMI